MSRHPCRQGWQACLASIVALLISALILLLGPGCAPAPVINTNETPVALSCPAPPLVERPALPVSNISPASPPDAIARAFAASLELLKGYAARLEALLDGYRKDDKETP